MHMGVISTLIMLAAIVLHNNETGLFSFPAAGAARGGNGILERGRQAVQHKPRHPQESRVFQAVPTRQS